MEIKAIRDLHYLIEWLLPILGKFPRNYRYSLGVRIENSLYEMLELLIQAKHSKKKEHYLQKVNVSLEIIRHQGFL